MFIAIARLIEAERTPVHPHARKILTYYTVEGHQTITVYNLTEGYAPTTVVTSDGRSWRRRGLMLPIPDDFELSQGDHFLSIMTMDDAEALADEIVERRWGVDPEVARWYESREEFRAVVMAGLATEVAQHRSTVLLVHA